MRDSEFIIVGEKQALDIKISKLQKALDSAILLVMSEEEERIIRDQLYYMTKYSEVLVKRIRSFK